MSSQANVQIRTRLSPIARNIAICLAARQEVTRLQSGITDNNDVTEATCSIIDLNAEIDQQLMSLQSQVFSGVKPMDSISRTSILRDLIHANSL